MKASFKAPLTRQIRLYSAELQRLKERLQMELRILCKPEADFCIHRDEYLRSNRAIANLQVDSEKAEVPRRIGLGVEGGVPPNQGLRAIALDKAVRLADFSKGLRVCSLVVEYLFLLSGPWAPVSSWMTEPKPDTCGDGSRH